MNVLNQEEELKNKRHTLAHLLASAVLHHYPYALPATGPSTENGFFYDFDFGTQEKVTEKDLLKIEQTMKEYIKKWSLVEKEVFSPQDAEKIFEKNPYKKEILKDIQERKEEITFYTTKDKEGHILFSDLCEGGHSATPSENILKGSFCLERVAGAYWRGNEKNPMLTRIYGLAFSTKEDLDIYKKQKEEAKKYDHRLLGKKLDLFTFSELVGSGLPLWTPKGTILRNALDSFVWELREKYGYEKVTIPHITKKDLYEKSGHWDKFSDELFRIHTREDKFYALKPMNCPHHTQIFARKIHSYKELPARYAETTMVYRDEQSGELGGLTRVLSITQDDSHIFCRSLEIKEEFYKVWDIIDTLYKTFDFTLHTRLSFSDKKDFSKYLGTKEVWEKSEKALLELAEERGANYFIAEGEAAMYGPKVDFMAKDSLGREHQVATIQLDMNLPERFDLSCINEKGEKERVVMIHSAIMGSLERFIAILIEHLHGEFPFRFSPVQIIIIPLSENHYAYSETILSLLKEAGIRAHNDKRNEPLGKRIKTAKEESAFYTLVIGDKEKETDTFFLEHKNGKEEVKKENLISFLKNK